MRWRPGHRSLRRALARIREAEEHGDWGAVVTEGRTVLDHPDVPPAAKALVQLSTGRARFMLGDHGDALAALEHGLRATPPEDVDVRPYRYWAGIAAMVGGDLDRARRHLEIVADDVPEAGDDFPVGSARRALAQLEAELGRPEAALAMLASMLQHEDAVAMTWALHGMAAQRAGLVEEARVSSWVAWSKATSHPDDDSAPTQATLAAALVNVAEVQVELGHADHAATVLDEADRRLGLAGGMRPGAALALPTLRAEVARLQDHLVDAERWLEQVDVGPDAPELEGARCRAAARLAWVRGDRPAAVDLYEQAASIFDGMDYRYQAVAARDEATTGPPTPQPHPTIGESMAEALEDERLDDAVLVVLPLSDDDLGAPGEALSLQEEVQSWQPAVEAAGGELDGWLTGGGELTVYLYGDPDRLWDAIEHDVRGLARRLGGGHVVRRRNDVETRLDL